MILYHGSNIEIAKIDLSLSKPNKDFGKAFYLSEDVKQAEAMAKYKSLILGGEPIITKFEFDKEEAENLNVLIFKEYSKQWAKFVFANRDKEKSNAHKYDIVYGPIANDRVGLQIINYKEGIISFEQLISRLKYIKGITFQYAFCTQEALKTLRKL